jgi:hypothetical protein
MSFDDGGIDGEWRKCLNPNCRKNDCAMDFAGEGSLYGKRCPICGQKTTPCEAPHYEEAEG